MTPRFFQVGGSVRDELLGLLSKDIDYAVEAPTFEAMRDAIQGRMGEIFLETPKYLTIRAKVPTLGACDFVLCRKDGAYSDGRHPEEVTPGSIYDDLARRDFTVNAIAKAEDGTLIDPHDGAKDLKAKHLRTVGLAKARFTEDGLRLLRALRFAVTKGFSLDVTISECLYDPDFFVPRLQGVSIERVREELGKMFSHDTNEAFEWFEIFPELRSHLFSDKRLWLKPTTEGR